MMGPVALVACALAALLGALALARRTPRVRALAEVGFTAVALANAWPLVAQYVPLSAGDVAKLDGLLHPREDPLQRRDGHRGRRVPAARVGPERVVRAAADRGPGGRRQRARALGDAAQTAAPASSS